MYFEIPRELVDDHRRRLEEAARTPMAYPFGRLWARLRRRERPAQIVSLPVREIERLAA